MSEKAKAVAVTVQIQVLTLPDAKASPRLTGVSLQENWKNLHNERTQMTTMASSLIGALSANVNSCVDFKSVLQRLCK